MWGWKLRQFDSKFFTLNDCTILPPLYVAYRDLFAVQSVWISATFFFFGGGDTGGEMEMIMGITSLPADVRRSIIYNGNSFGLRIRDHNRDQFDLFTYVCVQR